MFESPIFSNEYIDFLRSLSKKDLKYFSEFMDSPLFNKNLTQRKLLAELKKFYPKFANKNLTKENLFNKIYPDKKYTSKSFNNLISVAIKLSNIFLKLYPAIINHHRTEITLMDELNIRGLNKNFQRVAKQAGEKYHDESIYSSKLNDLYLFEVSVLRYHLKQNSPESIHYLKKVQDLWVFSFLTFSFYDIEELVIKESSQYSLTLKMIKQLDLEQILIYIKEKYSELAGQYTLYYFRLLAFLNMENDEYYYSFKEIFLQIHQRMTFSELTTNLKRLNALCYFKLYKHDKENFLDELFNIQKLTLDLNVFYEGRYKKHFQPYLYRNIIYIAYLNNDREWLNSFIKTYTPYIEDKLRDGHYNLGMLFYYFLIKDYDKTFEHLNKLKLTDVYLKMDIRNILLMIYYETGQYESAFSLIHSSEKFIKRNKQITSELHSFEKLFIECYTELLKFKTGGSVDIKYSFHKLEIKTYGEFKWLRKQFEKILK